jgi:hypothetical protein
MVVDPFDPKKSNNRPKWWWASSPNAANIDDDDMEFEVVNEPPSTNDYVE